MTPAERKKKGAGEARQRARTGVTKPRLPCATCGRPSTYWSSASVRRTNSKGHKNAYCDKCSPTKGSQRRLPRRTRDDVEKIRAMYVPYSRGPTSATALARRFGVCRHTIQNIGRGRTRGTDYPDPLPCHDCGKPSTRASTNNQKMQGGNAYCAEHGGARERATK